MAHTDGIKYSEVATPDELALAKDSARFSVVAGFDRVDWTCPRCKAELASTFRRNDPIYKFDIETVDAPGKQGVLSLTCECGVKHDGGDGKPGCGFAALLPVKE